MVRNWCTMSLSQEIGRLQNGESKVETAFIDIVGTLPIAAFSIPAPLS